jgi:hypothetical protein
MDGNITRPERLTDKRQVAEVATGCCASQMVASSAKLTAYGTDKNPTQRLEPYPKAKADRATVDHTAARQEVAVTLLESSPRVCNG